MINVKKIFIICISLYFICLNEIAFCQNYKVFTPQSYKKNLPLKQNEHILFIMDFSNSMNEKIDNTSKLEMALSSISKILKNVPDNLSMGLRIYGHKGGFNPFTSCKASELVVPISKDNKAKIEAKLYQTQAVGWTPITYSLQKAVVSDFAGFNGQKRIVLLTDGGENCGKSPCLWAIDLMKYRDDIKIDTIAFDLQDKQALDQLICTSLVTNGKFYNAKTTAELIKSLHSCFFTQKQVQGQILSK